MVANFTLNQQYSAKNFTWCHILTEMEELGKYKHTKNQTLNAICFHRFVFSFLFFFFFFFLFLVEQQWYHLTHSLRDKGVYTFPKGISPKVNVIARLEIELAYFKAAVQSLSHSCSLFIDSFFLIIYLMSNVQFVFHSRLCIFWSNDPATYWLELFFLLSVAPADVSHDSMLCCQQCWGDQYTKYAGLTDHFIFKTVAFKTIRVSVDEADVLIREIV